MVMTQSLSLFHAHVTEGFECVGLLIQICTVAIHKSSFVKKGDIAREYFCIKTTPFTPQIGLLQLNDPGVGCCRSKSRRWLLYLSGYQ